MEEKKERKTGGKREDQKYKSLFVLDILQKQKESLLAAIEGLCSKQQAKDLQNEVYLVGRSKEWNKRHRCDPV